MFEYKIADIPDMDPAEFTRYQSARQTGIYIHQLQVGEFIRTRQGIWVPIGKTTDPAVTDTTEVPSNVAIMWEEKEAPGNRTWWHIWASYLDDDYQVSEPVEVIEPPRRKSRRRKEQGKMTFCEKVKSAKQAIDSLFGDTSVPQEETLAALEEIRDDLLLKIEAIESDLGEW